jgi:hypothetical protein
MEVESVLVIGQLFVAGSICEALLLLASIGVGLASGPYKPTAVAFTVLVVVGVAAAAATAGLGAVMIQTSRRRVALMPGGTASMTGPLVVDSRAAVALVLGIAGIVLVWPLGMLLAPAAFWAGITAVRRISQDPARLGGRGRAKTGALIGSFISGMYLVWILLDVAAIFLFGSPIPAAP